MKTAYLAIKFHEDFGNRKLIEVISSTFEKAGLSTVVMVRDHEKWGEVAHSSKELMELTFKEIDKSDIFIVELSEKGVGLGIEAGYARSRNIPIIVIAKEGSEISNTLKGIAEEVILYKDLVEVGEKLKQKYI